MAHLSCKLPSERRVQVSNLLNCVIMYNGDFLDIDDLAMQACALLDTFRSRGLVDSLQRALVTRALEQNNRDRVVQLLAAIKAVIKEHDDKVQADAADLAAAQVALLAHASAAPRHVSLAQAPMHDASFPPMHDASCITETFPPMHDASFPASSTPSSFKKQMLYLW